MEEPKRFFIPAEGQLIEVSEEVYRAYYGMDRRERYLEERDLKNGLISYHTLDTPTHGGEAAMSNISAPSVEDEMLASELLTLLSSYWLRHSNPYGHCKCTRFKG